MNSAASADREAQGATADAGYMQAALELAAQAAAVVPLAPDMPAWTFGEDLSALQDLPLRVRVVLEIAPSPEATTHAVATGRAESDALLSQPPHRWLLPSLS